jgi:LysM repeat protein/GH25 family lysozyme M1 (1,4-beta-N-acetylmuramidase)
MLKGADISRHQGTIDWEEFKNHVDFVVIRTSFSADGRDDQYKRNVSEARRLNIPIWFYHFAYPDRGTTPDQEIDNFLAAINDVGGIQPGEGVVLDYERDLADPVPWCREFCLHLKDRVGFNPVFYSNENRITRTDWQPVVDLGCGLWVAKYGANDGNEPDTKPATGKWPFAAMWQYTSKATIPGVTVNTVDMNIFYGDVSQFKAYGNPANPATPTPAPNPEPTPSPAPTPAPIVQNSNVYIVVSGDTMSGIASKYGMSLGSLLRLNPQVTNPNIIHPGDRINVSGESAPQPAAGGRYTVKSGDNLSKIAASNGLTLAQIKAKNPQIKNPNLIYPGQVINI